MAINAVKEKVAGGTPEENATITRSILDGSLTGPQTQRRLHECRRCPLHYRKHSIASGIQMAEALIDSGAALRKLEEFIFKSNH